MKTQASLEESEDLAPVSMWQKEEWMGNAYLVSWECPPILNVSYPASFDYLLSLADSWRSL